MFKPVDSEQEKAIIASERKRTSIDYSIRTVTHWFTLPQHFGFCTVPSHFDNVPDADKAGGVYEKYPCRMVVEIDDYHVCRWCFVAEADLSATEPPVRRVREACVCPTSMRHCKWCPDAPGN